MMVPNRFMHPAWTVNITRCMHLRTLTNLMSHCTCKDTVAPMSTNLLHPLHPTFAVL